MRIDSLDILYHSRVMAFSTQIQDSGHPMSTYQIWFKDLRLYLR